MTLVELFGKPYADKEVIIFESTDYHVYLKTNGIEINPNSYDGDISLMKPSDIFSVGLLIPIVCYDYYGTCENYKFSNMYCMNYSDLYAFLVSWCDYSTHDEKISDTIKIYKKYELETATMRNLKGIREITGVGLFDCKKYYLKNDQNVIKTIIDIQNNYNPVRTI